jgi:hypothetical protein
MHYESGVFRGCDHACIVQRRAESLLRECQGEQTSETPMPPAEREAFIRSLATQLVLDQAIHGSYTPEPPTPTRGRSYLDVLGALADNARAASDLVDLVVVQKDRSVGPSVLGSRVLAFRTRGAR